MCWMTEKEARYHLKQQAKSEARHHIAHKSSLQFQRENRDIVADACIAVSEAEHELRKIAKDLATKDASKRQKTLPIALKHASKKAIDQYISDTDYLYSIAESQKWRLMLDYKGYSLPGVADPHPTCGSWRFSKCPDHDYIKRINHSCNMMSCPIYVRKAGSRIATKIGKRIWQFGLGEQSITKGRKNPKPSHVIESIGAGSEFWGYSASKKQRTLSQMRKLAGIRGGGVLN